MSNKKITDLPILTTFADDDVMPIVDASANVTKQSYIQDLATRFSQDWGEIGGTLSNQTDLQGALDAKQDNLVSGTNIKTINSTSLLGSGDVAVQETLVSGTNIKTINSTSLLGSGDISIEANPSGGAGLIQFSDGSAFASDSNLFWDNTAKQLQLSGSDSTGTIPSGLKLRPNLPISSSYGANIYSYFNNDKWLQISKGGTNYYTFAGSGLGMNLGQFGTPTAQLHIKGSGSTSATTSLLVQNSSGTEVLKVTDDSVTNARGNFNVLHPSVATRSLKLGWGSIFANDSGSELMLGAVFSIPSSPQILLAGNTRSSGANTMQLQAINGISVASSYTSPNSSAQLDISSSTKGFLPPRMTTTQKNAIASPAAGLQVYDTTLNQMSYYNGTSWIDF